MAYRRVARRKARKYGLDPKVFERQIQQESGFQAHIGSSAGAQGIAQIMPATARGWGVDPNNPRQALDAAAKNMASYVKKYGGYENALRAYNAGPGAIESSKGYAETNNYVKTILGGKDPGKLNRPQDDEDDGGPARGGTRGRAGRTRVTTTRTPGVSNRAARGQLIASFLEDKESDPLDLALGLKGLKDIPGTSSTTRKHTPGRAPTAPRGQRSGGGGGGGRPRGKYDIKELFWQGAGGINVKDNQKVAQGFVTGHQDHVHVAAGKHGVVSLGKLAQQMGLHVGENPHFGGVTPVHVTNSNHYSGQAIDVSGDPAKMRKYAHKIARLRKG